MYKYRVKRQKESKYQVEDLVSKKATIVSEEELKGFVKNGLVTNAVVRNAEILSVKDALETYIVLRERLWEVASLRALVGGKDSKSGVTYIIRFFDGYGDDVTQAIFDFVYMELNLKQDGKGNILYATRTLDPMENFKKAINEKAYKVQKNLVPEKSEMVYAITEYSISKAMKEVISTWDC